MEYLSAILGVPLALGILAVGIGLGVRRVSGDWLPLHLVPAAGLAGLICLGQLMSASGAVAPATIVVVPVIAASGLWWGRATLRTVPAALRRAPWTWLATVTTYLIVVAPVLAAGRATLTAYLLDSTAAAQLAGAERIVDHGRDFASLPASSYRLYLEAYFGNQYPSGAHVILGLVGKLLPANLMWLYTPFLATMLGFCVPTAAWIVRRCVGAPDAIAAVGSVLVAVPALVYAYALMGAIKEIALIPIVLLLLALVVLHPRWLGKSARAVVPAAVAAGGGLGVVGLAFGAWLAVAAAILIAVAVLTRAGFRRVVIQVVALAGLLVLLALPTVRDLASSLTLATSLSQSNAVAANDPGNLLQPIRWVQAFGVWLAGTHRAYPSEHFWATLAFIATVGLAGGFGVIALVRRHRWTALAFVVGAGAVWWALTERGTVWTDAKLVVLSSPIILLLAIIGISELALGGRRAEAALLLVAVAGGVMWSDALLYHDTNLAPTERFDEQVEINERFAGQGPALLTDFDEYALFMLRDLDPAGPGFARKPPGLDATRSGSGVPYGTTLDLDDLAIPTILDYRLVVMRRSPERSLPPMGYELAWRGDAYEVWRRTEDAERVRLHLPGQEPGRATRRFACSELRRLSADDGGQFAVSVRGATVLGDPRRAARSGHWVDSPAGGAGIVGPGRMQFDLRVPRSGRYRIWVKGDINRPIAIELDGRRVGTVAYESGGQGSYTTPVEVTIERGRRRIELIRGGGSLAPGNGGGSRIGQLVLEPAWPEARPRREIVSEDELDSLCREPLDWVEILEPAPVR